MPTIPAKVKFTAKPYDVLNAIRNNASANYQNYVPIATASDASIKEIGAIIMDYVALQNEFLYALVNRIGLVLLTNKMFENPLRMFKKGKLDFGETIEEIFVNLADPHTYDVATAENEVFKRQIPDVRAAFHILNYQKFYKTTIQQEQLRQAFLSWKGIDDLIAKIVDSMYSGASFDEFQMMKYLLARNILNGRLYPVQVSSLSAANAKSIVSTVKGTSNMLTFSNTKYNVAGVNNFTDKKDQIIILNSAADAIIDVEVLASAFNMSKAEFMGQRVLVDNFGDFDTDRLAQLFENNEDYTPFTSDEITALNSIPAVIVDRDYFMIFDNLYNFTEQYNGEGLYWNYWYHTWKTFSVSPFANAVVFAPGTPSITSVTVSPATATVSAGQNFQLDVEVVTTNFASKAVDWSVDTTSAGLGVTISVLGELHIPSDVDSNTEITVTAKSVVDATKYDTATITVA